VSRMSASRPARMTAVATAVATALVTLAPAGAHAQARPAAAARLPGAYVALGDSYTSGPGIPSQIPGSYLCFRSDHNYPSLVALAIKPTAFTDVSCAGAITGSMTGLQGLAAPQFNALGPDDRLVTVGISGNDVGFALIAIICLALAPLDPGGAPCRAYYTSGGTDRIAAAIAQTAAKIAGVLRGIHQRAPHARVLVVGYPDILPAAASDCAPGVNDPLAAGDIPWINGEEKALNRMLARQAAANGATYVDTYRSSIGHDACQAPGTRWVEGVVDVQNAFTIHPNALGMRNDARQILAVVNSASSQRAGRRAQ
jgi:lysophospholipase L1-like esterase